MTDKFKENFFIALPAAIVSLVIIYSLSVKNYSGGVVQEEYCLLYTSHIPVIYVRRDISKKFSANLICLPIKANDVNHHLILQQECADGIDCNLQSLVRCV